MKKIEKILWIALGTLPIPVFFFALILVGKESLGTALTTGVAVWVLATLAAVGIHLTWDPKLAFKYPRSEYVTIGLCWFISVFVMSVSIFTSINPSGWLKKITQKPFWKKEI